MKTPDEIKKGLECADIVRCPDKKCPYFASAIPCMVQVQKDALAMILQLEVENARLLEKNKQLENELNALISHEFHCLSVGNGGDPDA